MTKHLDKSAFVDQTTCSSERKEKAAYMRPLAKGEIAKLQFNVAWTPTLGAGNGTSDE